MDPEETKLFLGAGCSIDSSDPLSLSHVFLGLWWILEYGELSPKNPKPCDLPSD